MPLALVALGGNAIVSLAPGTVRGGLDVDLAPSAAALAALVARGFDLVVTHGNGPQVGDLLLATVPGQAPAPLDVLDAETQGSLGYLLQQALGNALRERRLLRPVATLVTQVVVDAADPAFQSPTKPVGPFLSKEQADRLRREKGWALVEDAGRGYRRVVPSPEPIEIVEGPAVKALVAAGVIVVAAGGGGIPVVRERDGRLRGAEAVIDKDRASALLARLLGVDLLLILTGVPHVLLDFRGPAERPAPRLSAAEARARLAAGEFPPGSMGPKVEAAAGFVEATGRKAVITSPERALAAVDGTAGTAFEA